MLRTHRTIRFSSKTVHTSLCDALAYLESAGESAGGSVGLWVCGSAGGSAGGSVGGSVGLRVCGSAGGSSSGSPLVAGT
jgi:hypothetical protein